MSISNEMGVQIPKGSQCPQDGSLDVMGLDQCGDQKSQEKVGSGWEKHEMDNKYPRATNLC